MSARCKKHGLSMQGSQAVCLLCETEREYQAMESADRSARKAGTLVGRYIQEPIGDGNAFYRIVKATQRTVTIEALAVGDAWVIPYWGQKATIKRSYAEESIRRREALAEIFDGEDHD